MSTSFADLLLNPRTSEGRALANVDNAALLTAVEEAPQVAQATLSGPENERIDASIVYQSVGAIMVEALRRRTDHIFSRGVVTLREIWEAGNPDAMIPTVTPDFEASLWENLGIILYAVGSLAGDWGQWAQARELTAYESPSSGEGWLRQGQVASACTAGPTDSYPALVTRRINGLVEDVDADEARRAFAIFDLFSALVITELDIRYGYYPNAAELDSELVEPFVIDQLRSGTGAARAQVFADDQDKLRDTLREYDAKARAAAAHARYMGEDWRWRAFADARTWSFINEGAILEQRAGPPRG